MDAATLPAEPHLEVRLPCAYVGIPVVTSLAEESDVVAGTLARLRQWLGQRRLRAAGPPFVRYRRIEMPKRLEIDVCLPLASPVAGDAPVAAGSLPGGEYAVLRHRGPLEGLVDANAALQAWARERGVRFACREEGPASTWDARVETYVVGPGEQVDAGEYVTEIAYLLAR